MNTNIEVCFSTNRRGSGVARGCFHAGRFLVSAHEAARLVRVWELGTPDNLSEIYVLDDSGRRVPVWTR